MIEPEIWITEKSGDVISFRSLNGSNVKKITAPSTLPELEFDNESKGILSDYLRLQLFRPFLQLASLRAYYLYQEFETMRLRQMNWTAAHQLLSTVIGSLCSFEISASVIATKNETKRVDSQVSNELVALCDSMISGIFYWQL